MPVELPDVKIKTQSVKLAGGLDVVTPPLELPPGKCILAQNFEHAVGGGYRRIPGYERYSGKARPSDATYTLLTVTVTGTIAVADVVTGVTSGATGTVIARPDGQVVVTSVTGTFVNGEVLNVAAAPQGTITAPPAPGGAATALLDAIGAAIDGTGRRLALMPPEERPGLVIVAIITDGHENMSRRYERLLIREISRIFPGSSWIKE